MKLLHLSDLHIGKKVHGYSMLKEQKEILNQILLLCEKENPDIVLIAGDIYDKLVPGEEAVSVMDYFLTNLNKQKRNVFIISGNHDSGERLQFGKEIMRQKGIYIAGMLEEALDCVTLSDEWGRFNIYMLPFIKPSMVRTYYKAENCEDAVRKIIEETKIDCSQRNLLIAHQFVTNGTWMPDCCDSENPSVGGLDAVDCKVFHPFDYVALGHLHQAQKVGRETIRYAGSPLKYSFSEVRHKKSATIVEMREKGEIKLTAIPLKPMHEMREIKGKLGDLIDPNHYTRANQTDYIRVILTDEEELYHPLDTLRNIYPNILRLDFENSRLEQQENTEMEIENETELELFEQFFQKQNQVELTSEQKEWIAKYLVK